MSYVNHALRRSTVQSLREYLLYGVEEPNTYSTKSYEVRLKTAFKQLSDIVKKYDEKGEESVLSRTINRVLTEYEHVYMELGIQSGFRLAHEIGGTETPEQLSEKYKDMYGSLYENITVVIGELEQAQKMAEQMYDMQTDIN